MAKRPGRPSQLQNLVEDLPSKHRRLYQRDVREIQKLGAQTIADVSALLSRKSTRGEIRAICCWLLGLAGRRSSVPLLISAYKSSNKKVMWEAAKALAKIGGQHVANIFIKQLGQRGHEERKVATAWALGVVRGRSIVPPLIKVLSNRRNSSRLRGEAAESLGNISDRRAIPALLRATYGGSVEVRFWAAFALGHLGGHKAFIRLKQLASSDHSRLRGWGTVSKEAALAIKQIDMLGLKRFR